ncbi:hypothetical protein ILUMI_11047 [Ignelater luminosus]|uniref:HTH CENPB-type domain-containing protein n=1 Tax=Ignelater luminosus TaxID=2038154 RepID=A0A8K0D180_IGNLU|nr:hypothetical protein ILUMI_11047 [Ignelater luminosus]
MRGKSSLTTSLRVVFDALPPSSSGKSLNDIEIVGPALQNYLFALLIRFLKYRYIASADIAKIHRQILIDEPHRRLQKIVWRDSPSESLKTYESEIVTYGHTAAPYLAIRCLSELINQIEGNHPTIAEIIRDDIFVDNSLTGADSIKEAAYICENVSKVLKTVCFELQKWYSNKPGVLKNVGSANQGYHILEFGEHENAKTLGLTYAGVFPNDIDRASLWWHGPSWLAWDSEFWSEQNCKSEGLPEIRNKSKCFISKENKLSPFNEYSDLRQSGYLFNLCRCSTVWKSQRFRALKQIYEEAVFTWFSQKRYFGQHISGPVICEITVDFNKELGGDSEFSASQGWLDKFKSWHGIRQLDIHGENLREMSAPGYKASKEQVTLMACANATGTHKIPMILIEKSQKPRCFKFIPEVKKFLELMGKQEQPALLLLDNAPSHPDAESLTRDGLKVIFLPSNMTSIMQSIDQSIIKTMKRNYRKQLLRRPLLRDNDDKEEEADSVIKFFKSMDLKDCCYMLLKIPYENLNGATDDLLPQNEGHKEPELMTEVLDTLESLKLKEDCDRENVPTIEGTTF